MIERKLLIKTKTELFELQYFNENNNSNGEFPAEDLSNLQYYNTERNSPNNEEAINYLKNNKACSFDDNV